MNGEKSAYSIMIDNVPVAYTHQSIRNIEKILLDNEASYDTVDYIYVVNRKYQLKGVVSIKDLFRLPKGSSVDDVMTKKVISVHPHTHQEKIVMVALKNNLKAIPVIDKTGGFLGIVPSDTILSIAHQELTEDLYRLEGITGKNTHTLSVLRSSPFRLLSVRLPWLLFGLLGGVFASLVVGHFENLLAEEIALIGFLPLMVYMSDAVGSQSQTIFIRSIAIEKDFSYIRYFLREMMAAILIATSLAGILGFAISFLHAPYLGVILGASLFFTILASVIIAIVTPTILLKLQKDPAVGSGPFATIIRDVVSMIIYFVIASLLITTVPIK